MEVLTLIVVPGFVGGFALALLLIRLSHRRPATAAPDTGRMAPLSTDAINMAHIPVSGVGGLGFLATAVLAAVFVPQIGRSLAIGFVLGGLMAAILIVWRRRAGPMPSSARESGANTTLSIDK